MRHAGWRSRQRSSATLQNRFKVEKNQFDVFHSVWSGSTSRYPGTHLPEGVAILGWRVGVVVYKDYQSSKSRLKNKVQNCIPFILFFFTLLDLLFIGYLQLHTLPKKFPFTLCCRCFFSFSFDYFRYRKFLGTELNSVVLYVFDRGHYLLTWRKMMSNNMVNSAVVDAVMSFDAPK